MIKKLHYKIKYEGFLHFILFAKENYLLRVLRFLEDLDLRFDMRLFLRCL